MRLQLIFTFLNYFYFKWGIKANDWALLLFLALLFYYVCLLFYIIPNLLPKENLIKFYLKKRKSRF